MENDFNKFAIWLILILLQVFGWFQQNRIADLESRLDFYDTGFKNAFWKIIELQDAKTGEVKYYDIMIKGPVEPIENPGGLP